MIQDKIFFDEKDPTGLSYNTPFTYYGSYQGRLWSKSPSGSIQYYTQNSDLSAYATTGSNQFSGSQTVTGSLTVTGTITGTVAGTTATASYVEYTNVANKPALVSGSAQIASFGIFATTGSNGFNGSQSITGSLTVTGQVVAQTLNVQQVTSSVVYSSGSNIFGNELGNTQQFTGSMSVTGSLAMAGAGTFSSKVGVGGASATYPLTAYNASNGTTAAFGGTARGIRIDNDGTFSSGRSTIFGVDNTFYGSYQPLAIGGSELYFSISGTDRLTISSTGAATFSNNVNVSGDIQLNSTFGTVKTSANNSVLILLANPSLVDNETRIELVGRTYESVGNSIYYRAATHIFTDSAAATERMRITSGGNVGIGTASPDLKLSISGTAGNVTTDIGNGNLLELYGGTISSANNGVGIRFTRAGSQMAFISAARENASDEAGFLSFATQTGAGAHPERMRITSGGFLKASNNGSYQYPTNAFHSFDTSIADWTFTITNKNATSGNGILISYLSAPNNASSAFLYAQDSGVARFQVYSNGGIANFQANNVNLSDERTKKDITPLESYWDKFKAIEIVKFKYKDQTHDDFNIGVIAQQVESVAPEFVDVDGWNTKPELDEEGNEIVSTEEPLKSIYTADLYHATIKVLQEAMTKIEILEAKIQTLEQQ